MNDTHDPSIDGPVQDFSVWLSSTTNGDETAGFQVDPSQFGFTDHIKPQQPFENSSEFPYFGDLGSSDNQNTQVEDQSAQEPSNYEQYHVNNFGDVADNPLSNSDEFQHYYTSMMGLGDVDPFFGLLGEPEVDYGLAAQQPTINAYDEQFDNMEPIPNEYNFEDQVNMSSRTPRVESFSNIDPEIHGQQGSAGPDSGTTSSITPTSASDPAADAPFMFNTYNTYNTYNTNMGRQVIQGRTGSNSVIYSETPLGANGFAEMNQARNQTSVFDPPDFQSFSSVPAADKPYNTILNENSDAIAPLNNYGSSGMASSNAGGHLTASPASGTSRKSNKVATKSGSEGKARKSFWKRRESHFPRVWMTKEEAKAILQDFEKNPPATFRDMSKAKNNMKSIIIDWTQMELLNANRQKARAAEQERKQKCDPDNYKPVSIPEDYKPKARLDKFYNEWKKAKQEGTLVEDAWATATGKRRAARLVAAEAKAEKSQATMESNEHSLLAGSSSQESGTVHHTQASEVAQNKPQNHQKRKRSRWQEESSGSDPMEHGAKRSRGC